MMHQRRTGEMNRAGWNYDNIEPNSLFERRIPGELRNRLYRNAYGEYSGGYRSQNTSDSGPGLEPAFWQRRQHPPQPPSPPHITPLPPPAPHITPQPPPLIPPLPPYISGREFGPIGPPMKRLAFEDRAIKHLIRCGVPKDSVKTLPRDLLQLVETQYCGLCSQSFDSFTSSRIHYVSKQHQRAQKQWLSQRNASGYSLNEEPLRSRDLYCELCDVHLTSRQHADSHYNGKPHLAVVYGRKNPKNAILLQKHMLKRLELLLRREKKHMKIGNENSSTEGQGKEDSKNNSPGGEVFCDICQVTMTSPEVMTQHLNGKKHLSKEKQHIMNIMKIGRNADPISAHVASAPEEGQTADPSTTTVISAKKEGPVDTKVPETSGKATEDYWDWGKQEEFEDFEVKQED